MLACRPGCHAFKCSRQRFLKLTLQNIKTLSAIENQKEYGNRPLTWQNCKLEKAQSPLGEETVLETAGSLPEETIALWDKSVCMIMILNTKYKKLLEY